MKIPRFKGFHIVSDWMVMILTLNISNIGAITVFPFVFYRDKYIKSHQNTRNEETIHILQQMECGPVGFLIYVLIGIVSDSWLVGLPALFLFFILYILFFIVNIFRFGKRAYEEIPFEREAKRNSNRSVYIGLRKPFSWIRYIG